MYTFSINIQALPDMKRKEFFWKTAEVAWDGVRLATLPVRLIGYTGIALAHNIQEAKDFADSIDGGFSLFLYEAAFALPGVAFLALGIAELSSGQVTTGALATGGGALLESFNLGILGSSVIDGIKITYEHGVEKRRSLRQKRALRRTHF